jgi:hypothetical protein
MRKKNSLQQLLIHAPKIYALGKFSSLARNFARSRGRVDTAFSCVSLDRSKGERACKRIRG